jgi:DNA-binding phage protein
MNGLKDLGKKLKGMDLSKYTPEVLETSKTIPAFMKRIFSKENKEFIKKHKKEIEEILKKEESN